MSKFIRRLIVSLRDSRANTEVIRRLLLGVVIPVLLLSTTYSSVFFMKGEVWWSVFYGLVMAISGWCLVQLMKCGSSGKGDSDEG